MRAAYDKIFSRQILDKPYPTAVRNSHHTRTGVLVGGSGLIGGTLLHHFKGRRVPGLNVVAPNSKELSLRVPEDIRSFFEAVKPEFIINCAIASIDADPEMTFDVTSMGAINLARAALELGIPYIHISSSAVMPTGHDLREEDRLPIRADLSNYAKGKLIAELALEELRATRGLDYTAIRLAVVYGAHDHKIQGFHRLLFSLVGGSMPFMLTGRRSVHSYTNANKLPAFVSHVLENRAEFTGQTYHFVDPEPVALGELILAIKSLLGTKAPRAFYVPYPLARLALKALTRLARVARRVGIEARAPAESIFLANLYESQVLSSEKLRRSSFVDPDPAMTVYTALPALLAYYVRRWEGLNLIDAQFRRDGAREDTVDLFVRAPERLLRSALEENGEPFLRRCSIVPPSAADDPAGDRRGGPPPAARARGRSPLRRLA